MIDYNEPDDDPIVAEVRRAREEYAAKFNYDLTAIREDLQRLQTSSGRKYVSPPSEHPELHPGPSKKAG
jgi:hypothetical protein